jgi:hypothetical protein
VQAARQFFADDLSRVLDYCGSSRLSGGLPVPVSPSQLGYASGNLPFARVLTGNAMEARVFEQILTDPQDYQLSDQLSGASRIDFVGPGDFEGFTFELTTEGGVAAHALREYLQPMSLQRSVEPSLTRECANGSAHRMNLLCF